MAIDNYGLSLGGAGDLQFGLQTSYVLEYNTSDQLLGPKVDVVGRRSVPEYRINFDASWTLGRHTVALNSYFIPSQCESSTLNPDFDPVDFSTLYNVCWTDPATGSVAEVDSFLHHNLAYVFEAPWDARIMVGVNNVTDEDPVLDRNNAFSFELYPLIGRAWVASYTQRF